MNSACPVGSTDEGVEEIEVVGRDITLSSACSTPDEGLEEREAEGRDITVRSACSTPAAEVEGEEILQDLTGRSLYLQVLRLEGRGRGFKTSRVSTMRSTCP